MNARWVSVLLSLMVLAIPARGQGTESNFIGPDGKKQVGPYVWAWHTALVAKSSRMEIEADCPLNFVVLGGGYVQVLGFFAVLSAKPNQAFDGWVITGGAGYSGPAKVTVYASCGPVK